MTWHGTLPVNVNGLESGVLYPQRYWHAPILPRNKIQQNKYPWQFCSSVWNVCSPVRACGCRKAYGMMACVCTYTCARERVPVPICHSCKSYLENGALNGSRVMLGTSNRLNIFVFCTTWAIITQNTPHVITRCVPITQPGVASMWKMLILWL